MENQNLHEQNLLKDLNTKKNQPETSKWVNNSGDEVRYVFGFNNSAELVNGRAAMIGFLMLILTELVFKGRPVTSSIFGINSSLDKIVSKDSLLKFENKNSIYFDLWNAQHIEISINNKPISKYLGEDQVLVRGSFEPINKNLYLEFYSY